MAKLVTIYGGSGFLGRYIAQQMAREGWRVRVAVRRPNQAMQARTYGTVGQVEPMFCNVRDDASVAAAMAGADAVVNCVGIMVEQGKNNFEAVQNESAGRIARIASEVGVSQLVHISAIGADLNSASDYARSKAQGEQAVQEHFPSAVILRPSVMFGAEDRFFNKFATMTRLGPVLAIVGGGSRMQPVYVHDVARAAVMGVLGRADGGIYELGGPEVHTLRELIQLMLGAIKRRRLIVNLPFWVGSVIGWWLDLAQTMTLSIVPNTILTRDQVRLLRNDNVVSDDAKGFSDLGIEPVAVASVLPEYLWVFRPSGQFSAIRDSAKNLKA
jgi:uncharacterized protein YbjT (DUF2867 family)